MLDFRMQIAAYTFDFGFWCWYRTTGVGVG